MCLNLLLLLFFESISFSLHDLSHIPHTSTHQSITIYERACARARATPCLYVGARFSLLLQIMLVFQIDLYPGVQMESQIIFQLLTMAFYGLNGVLISDDSMPVDKPFICNLLLTFHFSHLLPTPASMCIALALLLSPRINTFLHRVGHPHSQQSLPSTAASFRKKKKYVYSRLYHLSFFYIHISLSLSLSTRHGICTQRYMLRFSRIV